MRKLTVIALVVTILLSTMTFSHAEGFSLHNGVKFGMTMDEVKAIEGTKT